MQIIVPTDFAMFQNFKHWIVMIACITISKCTTHKARCDGSRPKSNLNQRYTQYTTVHLQCPPNHHFTWKIQHFYGEGRNKDTVENSPKHTISGDKSIFPRSLPDGRVPPHHTLYALPPNKNFSIPQAFPSGGSTLGPGGIGPLKTCPGPLNFFRVIWV